MRSLAHGAVALALSAAAGALLTNAGAPIALATPATPLTAAAPLAATAPQAPHELCQAATEMAEKAQKLPSRLLRAVSLVESGRQIKGAREAWPWTINLEGAGRWFKTRAEALAFARAALKKGKTSFDVGCMQINYRWHAKHFKSLEEMFDPLKNADYAARYLSRLQAETGDWMAAAGYYHSRTPSLSTKYKARIAIAYRQARAEERLARKEVVMPAPLAKSYAKADAEAKAKVIKAVATEVAKPGPRRGRWPGYGGKKLIDFARTPKDGGDAAAWRGLVRASQPLVDAELRLTTPPRRKPKTAGVTEKLTSAPAKPSAPKPTYAPPSAGGLSLSGLISPPAKGGGLIRPAKPFFK
ncbi:MAG: lytic transglycosylase domain-containing protein [Neomegalonema sp.]|nr:lytic transglycosylase domain-containing protein [Neomegalonema sp.]